MEAKKEERGERSEEKRKKGRRRRRNTATRRLEREEKLSKIQSQFAKHGCQFLGPIKEDVWHNLMLCRGYHRFQGEKCKEDLIRHELVAEMANAAHHQVQRTWLELFTDLIFVAVIVKLANQIKENYKEDTANNDKTKILTTFLESVLFFVPFFMVWLELNVTLIRFADVEGSWYGVIDDFLLLVFMCGVTVLSVTIQSDKPLFDEDRNRLFIVSMVVCLSALFFLHFFYYQKIAASQKYCKRRMIAYFAATAAMLIGLVPVTAVKVIALSIGSLIVLYTSFISFRVHPLAANPKDPFAKYYKNPIISLFTMRFGVYTMIVLGESILAILIDPEVTAQRYIIVYAGFAMIFLLKLIYFESHADDDCHALNEIDFPGSVAWVFAHLPLGYCLLALGVGMKLLFFGANLLECPWQWRLMIGVATPCCISIMLFIRTAHEKFIWSPVSWLRILPLVVCPLGVFLSKDSTEMIVWCLMVTFISYLMDVYFIERYETKPEWAELEESKAEFLFHPEEYAWYYLFYDWIRCDTVTRTLEVTLREAQVGHDNETQVISPKMYTARDLDFDVKDLEEEAYEETEEEEATEETEKETLASFGVSSHGTGHAGHAGHEAHEAHEGHESHDSHEDHENTWFGEFTDLIFVAVVINFADQFKKMTTVHKDGKVWPRLLAENALFFFTFFVVWFELMVSLVRFTNIPGMADDVIKFLYLAGIVQMTLVMHPKHYLFQNIEPFIAGVMICVVTSLALHSLYYKSVENCQPYCRRRIVGYAIALVLLIVCESVNNIFVRIVGLFCADVVLLWNAANSFRVVETPQGKRLHIPEWVFEQITERWGLLVMITTGESILALITSSDQDFVNAFEDYLVVVCAFCIMFFMKDIYFESCNVTEEDHALAKKGTPGAVMWTIAHGVLAYFLMLTGTAWKLVFKSLKKELKDKNEKAQQDYLFLLGIATSCAILCMYWIRMCHKKFVLAWQSVLIRSPPFVFLCTAPLFLRQSWSMAVSCCFWVFYSSIIDHFLIEGIGVEVRKERREHYKQHNEAFAAISDRIDTIRRELQAVGKLVPLEEHDADDADDAEEASTPAIQSNILSNIDT